MELKGINNTPLLQNSTVSAVRAKMVRMEIQ